MSEKVIEREPEKEKESDISNLPCSDDRPQVWVTSI